MTLVVLHCFPARHSTAKETNFGPTTLVCEKVIEGVGVESERVWMGWGGEQNFFGPRFALVS